MNSKRIKVAIFGGSGSSIIYAGEGNVTVHGGSGNELIAAGHGNANLDGGNGDDLLATNSRGVNGRTFVNGSSFERSR